MSTHPLNSMITVHLKYEGYRDAYKLFKSHDSKNRWSCFEIMRHKFLEALILIFRFRSSPFVETGQSKLNTCPLVVLICARIAIVKVTFRLSEIILQA